MMSDNEMENVLPKKLMAFWRSKGCDVESVEAMQMPRHDGAFVLVVNFLPSASSFLAMSFEWEDAVKWLIYFIVKKGYTKGLGGFQACVNFHRVCVNHSEPLVRYVCHSVKLRELERRRHFFFDPLSRKNVSDMISCRSSRTCSFSRFLRPAEYPKWLDDNHMLSAYLLRCVEADWLKLSEVYLLVRKITGGSGVSGDATVERTPEVIRCLLEDSLVSVGEVVSPHDGQKDGCPFFRDSTLSQEELLVLIREEIRRFSGNESYKTTFWLRNAEKTEAFFDVHESESKRLNEWFHELFTDSALRLPQVENGLHLNLDFSEHAPRPMSYKSNLKALISRRRYICSCAIYGSNETRSGWIRTTTGIERPLIVKVFIWDVKDEMTRSKARCIARVSGCIRLNGNNEIKVEYEKGEGELGVDIVDSPIHETAKNIRLRYKGAEALVMLQADMTEQNVEK